MSGSRTRSRASAESAGQGGFLAQLRRPGVLAFYGCVALMQLAHGPYYTFFSIHLETLGYSRSFIGLMWALGVVAEILLFLVMARLLERFSLRQVLLASFLIAALRWLLLGQLADHLGVLLIAQLMHAATFGSFHAAAIHFVQRSFGHRQQGQGQALYASLSGIGGALGALYAGYAWSGLGGLVVCHRQPGGAGSSRYHCLPFAGGSRVTATQRWLRGGNPGLTGTAIASAG